MTNWTDQQAAILDAWEKESHNIIIRANAGTGKSTVLAEAMNRSDAVGMYFAFMNKNVDDMAGRIEDTPHMASTLNSYGNKLMRSYLRDQVGIKPKRIDKWKYLKIAKQVLEPYAPNTEILDNWGFEIKDMTTYVRAYMVDPSDEYELLVLAQRFNIDHTDKPWFLEVIKRVMEIGKNQLMNGMMDFDDQIWGPVAMNIQPTETYDAVYVDECQDLTISKIKLAMMACTPGQGKMMLAGDPRQAIFGFAGADSNSYTTCKDLTGATEYPMTFSWRFGDRIAEFSREIVPELIGKNPTSEDVVEYANIIPQTVDENTAIVARTNAELVATAIMMLKADIPANMKSNKLGWEMLKAFDNLNKDMSYEWSQFPMTLYAYWLTATDAMREKGVSKRKIGLFEEALDCLKIAYKKTDAANKAQFRDEIETIFKRTDGTHLTTAHGGKGGEWDVVYVINPGKFREFATNHANKIRGGKATEESYWVVIQETNALYVAQTRAKNRMYLLPERFDVQGYTPKQQDQTEKPVANERSALFGGISKFAPEARTVEVDYEKIDKFNAYFDGG